MRRCTIAGIAVLIAIGNAANLRAQSQPAFEVASVKAHKAGDNRRAMPQFLAGGRFTTAGVPLRFLISIAYDVGFQSVRLSGGPDWASSMDSTWDIDATPGKDVVLTGIPSNVRAERLRLMLQALLAERFKLQVRVETKEMSVYALVVGKSGPKLQKSKIEEKDCPDREQGQETPGVSCHAFMGGRGRGLHGEAVTLADVAHFVENWSDRAVVDKTGIPGLFNIQTRGWVSSQPGPPPPPGAKGEDGSDLADAPTLFNVFDPLGLKLESQKAPVEIYVIEHAEKATEN
jgi:uncharacterized protein (TIGR03435 family)